VDIQTIFIADLALQYAQLIARRIRELTSFSVVLRCKVRPVPEREFRFRAATPFEVGLSKMIDGYLISSQLGETR
jgi:GMP synthase-like glutamine amidotransferase